MATFKQIRIGVIGEGNVGKSTLINALIGSKLLPSKYITSTAVLTTVIPSLNGQEDPVARHLNEEVVGRDAVRKKIQQVNEQERRELSGQVHDIVVRSGARTSLDKLLNSGVMIVDVPGHNEADNPAVAACLSVVLSLCEVVLVLVSHDQIKSTGLSEFLERLQCQAPHVFSSADERVPAKLAFVVTKVDQVDVQGMDDSDDETDRVGDLKRNFREFLESREFLHGIDYEVMAISVRPEVLAGGPGRYDFERLEAFLLACSRSESITALASSRKRLCAKAIWKKLELAFSEGMQGYPEQAAKVVASKVRKERYVAAAVAVGLVGLAAGGALGWVGMLANATRAALAAKAAADAAAAAGAGQAVVAAQSSWWALVSSSGIATAQAAAATAAATAASSAGAAALAGECAAFFYTGAVAVAGGTVATSVGFATAAQAEEDVKFDAAASDVVNGTQHYQDTMKVLGTTVYVGSFLGGKPDGDGTLFWPSGEPAVVGKFEAGVLKDGLFIGSGGVLLGRLRPTADGFEEHGFQPEFLCQPECTICMERPTMISEGTVLFPCTHGNLCEQCARHIMEAGNKKCPLCDRFIQTFVRF